jgi:hypothetical protein
MRRFHRWPTAACTSGSSLAHLNHVWHNMQEKTQGLTFYSAAHPDELRPLVQTIWEFLLPTLSTTFTDAGTDQLLWHECLQGLVEAACLTCCLGLDFIASAFVRTLANFTSLHEPQSMRMLHAHALRQLLTIPDRVGALPTIHCVTHPSVFFVVSSTHARSCVLHCGRRQVRYSSFVGHVFWMSHPTNRCAPAAHVHLSTRNVCATHSCSSIGEEKPRIAKPCHANNGHATRRRLWVSWLHRREQLARVVGRRQGCTFRGTKLLFVGSQPEQLILTNEWLLG